MNIINRVKDYFSVNPEPAKTAATNKWGDPDKWGDPWLDPHVTYQGNPPDLAACQRRNSFAHNKCPHCGEKDLRLGPSGPGAQNVLCASCGSKFNDTGVFGVDLLRDCTNPIPEMDTDATHDHFGMVQPALTCSREVINKKNQYMQD